MAQNISWMGNDYSGVPYTQFPKTGGGNATFYDVSDTTAIAADVGVGKYFYTAAGVRTEGTASGGGGASNVVTGTFKGTTTGAAMNVTLNYSGSGYPIVVVIYAKEGAYNPSGTFYNTVQRYALTSYTAIRNVPTLNGYVGENNLATYRRNYKSSASTASSLSSGGSNNNNTVFNDADATSANNVTIRSATKMSVFIAGTSYGFAANIEYTYYVIYSS